MKYAWDFIINRNDTELLYNNRFIMFGLMWYVETSASLSINILEGLTYSTLTIF